MANERFFQPEDFDSIISLGDLTQYINTLILDIRNNAKNYKEIYSSIEQLEQIVGDNEIKELDIINKYKVYKQITHISLQLRKMLSFFFSGIEIYDGIEYGIYYNNKRYSIDTIDASWLVEGDGGRLELDLSKMSKDLSESYKSELAIKIQKMFATHFASFKNAINGTYKGTHYFNNGHLAEAFERHISTLEHGHGPDYQILRSLPEIGDNINMEAIDEKMLLASWWSPDHESMNEAWAHVRASAGNQRGTVAGDVLNVQVKQGHDNGGNVRLTSVSNLKKGFENYSKILNPKISAAQVAKDIALYLTERVKNADKEVQANIANENLSPEIQQLLKKKWEFMYQI